MRAIICGGTPTEHDLAVMQEFAAALSLPTREETRAVLYEMSTRDEGS